MQINVSVLCALEYLLVAICIQLPHAERDI